MPDMLDSSKGAGVATKRTICEVHRSMYDVLVLELLQSNPETAEKLIGLLEEAFVMGIKMSHKLREYKYNMWDDAEFNQKDGVAELRQRRIDLLKKMKKAKK